MNNTLFIEFLLDETGSMISCKNETIAGFNNYVESLKNNSEKSYLTLSKFDTSGVRTPYVNLDVNCIPPLSFHPNASTNLYDCAGERLEAMMQFDHGKSLFVMMTDGADNASRKYNESSLRSLIQKAISNGIVVVYMGPSDTALSTGERLGIPEGNIKPFDTTNMIETMNTLSASTAAYVSGQTTSKKFFV